MICLMVRENSRRYYCVSSDFWGCICPFFVLGGGVRRSLVPAIFYIEKCDFQYMAVD